MFRPFANGRRQPPTVAAGRVLGACRARARMASRRVIATFASFVMPSSRVRSTQDATLKISVLQSEHQAHLSILSRAMKWMLHLCVVTFLFHVRHADRLSPPRVRAYCRLPHAHRSLRYPEPLNDRNMRTHYVACPLG